MTPLTDAEREELTALLAASNPLPEKWLHRLFPNGRKAESVGKEYRLVYDGKLTREEVLAQTPAAPWQLVRSFCAERPHEEGWRNLLVWGDNLLALRELLADQQGPNRFGTRGNIKLIYIDPPFATRQDFMKDKEKVLGASLVPTAFGQGFQRHLIFVLIRLASSYSPPAEPKQKKEFSPELTWILFEEPEAFLHPTQIEILDTSLRSYAAQPGRQVLLSTHSPVFASRSIDAIPSLTRLCREGAHTIASQIKADQLQSVLAANQACIDDLKKAGIDVTAEDETLAMESIKFALWLNPLRASLFFAERVLLVEGPTEYALLSFLLARQEIQNPRRGVAIIDTLGKWNTHRFMNILGALRIPHSVLHDLDGSSARSLALKKAIQAACNEFTKAIDTFPDDLERFLGVPASARPDRKPQHMMWHLNAGKIDAVRLDALRGKVQALLDA